MLEFSWILCKSSIGASHLDLTGLILSLQYKRSTLIREARAWFDEVSQWPFVQDLESVVVVVFQRSRRSEDQFFVRLFDPEVLEDHPSFSTVIVEEGRSPQHSTITSSSRIFDPCAPSNSSTPVLVSAGSTTTGFEPCGSSLASSASFESLTSIPHFAS